MIELVDYLVKPYESYSNTQIYLEAIAAFFGLLSVVFSMLKKVWVFPTGMISTFIYVYLLFNWGLYGDTMINAYYFVMSVYGWYFWLYGGDDEDEAPVSMMNTQEKKQAVGIFLATILLVLTVYYFKPYIENGFDSIQLANLSFQYDWIQYVDSITTAIFFVGMWLMARKKVENWVFWIVGDLISVPMYLVKGYGITAGQYLIFIIPAVMGLILWYRDYKKTIQKV
ncbi:nicotinamide riboside transporter [Flavobacteriaceae bacterium UJ101]|nr:nicotinamide riboside transporter [Flavobacteriaceae bacterium UJ101]